MQGICISFEGIDGVGKTTQVERLRADVEAQGREISGQLYLFGVGAQMLRYASPPVSQAWCRMMLDPRGGAMLSEQVISEVLGRATGGGR